MHWQTAVVIALITFQAMLAVMIIGSPEAFGLSPVVLNYLAVLNVGCGALLNQLEKLGGPTRRVETETTTVEVPGREPMVQTVVKEQGTAKTDEAPKAEP